MRRTESRARLLSLPRGADERENTDEEEAADGRQREWSEAGNWEWSWESERSDEREEQYSINQKQQEPVIIL